MDHTPESRILLTSLQGVRVISASKRRLPEMTRKSRISWITGTCSLGASGFARIFSRLSSAATSASVQILGVDGTTSKHASIVANYATQIVLMQGEQDSWSIKRQIPESCLTSPTANGGPVPAVIPVLTAQSRVWFNSGSPQPRLFSCLG